MNINGSYYTLKECVDNGYIKPLVLIGSQSWSSSYIFSNFIDVFYTGGQTSTASYATAYIIFMTNDGYTINGFQLYSNKAFSTTYDGYSCRVMDINNLRLTL